MADFVMPRLGADMEAGTLVEWRKQTGETVQRGDVIAEVETDKGVIDVEVFSEGVVDTLLVQPGQKVPVGTVLATIREEGSPTWPSPTQTLERGITPAPTATGAQTAHKPDGQRSKASPAARRLARERGIDVSGLDGTGPGGSVTREDVLRRSQSTTPSPVPSPPMAAASHEQPTTNGDRQRRMRQTIAAAMSRSKREIPHYYLSTTISLQRAMSWLAEENLKRNMPDRLLPGVLLLKATAVALREVPELNAVWEQETVVTKADIHVGVAVSLRQGGLIAPAIHNTDQRTLNDLMTALRDVTQRARTGGLRSSELSDPTITVTSLGERGVESVFGVIYPPQVAIVGFGKMVERPWAEAGGLFVRPLVTATLSGDHRVSDGHRGGLFLNAIDRLLQEPEKL